MMFPGSGMGGWMMAAVSILALLLLGLAVVTVVALLRLSNSGSGRGTLRPSARELLDQRYARGEIDDDEYYRRLSVLDSAGSMTDGSRS